MSKKVHMQDQMFNNVKHIMRHRPRSPITLRFAGICLTLQFPVETSRKQAALSANTLVH